MRVLHSSDLRGDLGPLFRAPADWDVWVDSGHLLPDDGCDLRPLATALAALLDGRPALWLPVGRDATDLVVGMPPRSVAVLDGPADVGGARFAGVHPGRTGSLRQDPDVVVSDVPVAGSQELSRMLARCGHRVVHLHGGGQVGGGRVTAHPWGLAVNSTGTAVVVALPPWMGRHPFAP